MTTPIKNVTRKTYMTRADFMSNIKLPTSTSTRIIIPSTLDGDAFLTDCYNSDYLAGIIEENEFNSVIETITKIA
jgi:hypothetical protein